MTLYRLCFAFLILSLFPAITAKAQTNNIQLQIIIIDSEINDSTAISKTLVWKNLPRFFPDETSCKTALFDWANSLRNSGWWAFSIDSFSLKPRNENEKILAAYTYIGPRYAWNQIVASKNNSPPPTLPFLADTAKLNKQLSSNKTLPQAPLLTHPKALLQAAENNGYPFAEVIFDSLTIKKPHRATAYYQFKANNYIVLDSFTVFGSARLNKTYLARYLNLKKGRPYSEAQLHNASNRLRELAFAKPTQPPQIRFAADKAYIDFYADAQKASRFNLLLGVLPNPQANAINGQKRYALTGEGELLLLNAFNGGELWQLQFKQYPGKTSQLMIQTQYPYLPVVPLGANVKFDLYLRDTLYRDLTIYGSLQYILSGNNWIKGFIENKTTTLLSVNTNWIKTNKTLPSNLDQQHLFYGFEANYEALDFRLNPLKGWQIMLQLATGTRKLKQNTAIIAAGNEAGINLTEAYNQLNTQNRQWRLHYSLAKFWPLSKRMTIKTQGAGGYLAAFEPSENELFRIGGNKLFRGFNEDAFLTANYQIATLEARFLWSAETYIFLFADGGYLWRTNKVALQKTNPDAAFADFTFATGLGFTFPTKAGIFGLSYAVGSILPASPTFKSGKIHLGYVNYF